MEKQNNLSRRINHDATASYFGLIHQNKNRRKMCVLTQFAAVFITISLTRQPAAVIGQSQISSKRQNHAFSLHLSFPLFFLRCPSSFLPSHFSFSPWHFHGSGQQSMI
jgi:hypothetical protein